MAYNSLFIRIFLIFSVMTSASPLGATVHTINWVPPYNHNETIEITIGGLSSNDNLQAKADSTIFIAGWSWIKYYSGDADPWRMWWTDLMTGDLVNLVSGETSWNSRVLVYSGYGAGPLLGYSIGARLTQTRDSGVLTIHFRSALRDQCGIAPYARIEYAYCWGSFFGPVGGDSVIAEIELSTTSPSSFVEVRTFRWTGPALPEPAAWAMMVAGFGLVGGALRRRGHVAATAG